MEKNCLTCKSRDKAGFDLPCCICSGLNPLYEHNELLEFVEKIIKK